MDANILMLSFDMPCLPYRKLVSSGIAFLIVFAINNVSATGRINLLIVMLLNYLYIIIIIKKGTYLP